MAQKYVEAVIGRLATDEALRRRFHDSRSSGVKSCGRCGGRDGAASGSFDFFVIDATLRASPPQRESVVRLTPVSRASDVALLRSAPSIRSSKSSLGSPG